MRTEVTLGGILRWIKFGVTTYIMLVGGALVLQGELDKRQSRKRREERERKEREASEERDGKKPPPKKH